ncbi:MAG: GNAT family N-acetyltransferase [Acidithiobacillus ferriphilus]|jgi:GNAT superfamily N-acetyltransferase|nr:GNAT family N-acetyltransferase [Acidithiobacillus ferriphilus]MBW9254448.1 GNAT family N-acetyltransferase [Acidithiobacillus ferriphilus]
MGNIHDRNNREAEMVIRLLAKNELTLILPLVQTLNPGVPPEVLAQRLQDMIAQGYQCAAAFADDCCIGVAGIWLGTRFWCGRYLDVDNVIVDPQYRGRGIGQQLMDWVERYAHREDCETLVLDAYVTNHPAHKFYQRNGYQIVGHHFVKSLRSTD